MIYVKGKKGMGVWFELFFFVKQMLGVELFVQ